MTASLARTVACIMIVVAIVAGAAQAADDAGDSKLVPAPPVVQPEEVVHPPVRTESPKADGQPRIALANDEAACRLAISVDGAEAAIYRYGRDLGCRGSTRSGVRRARC